MSSQPSHGARFTLRRLPRDDEMLLYHATVFLPHRVAEYSVEIDPTTGASQIGTNDEDKKDDEIPHWAQRHLASLVKQIARAGARSGDWPRRMTRWRAGEETR